jgi:hypothetical protein
MASPRLIPCKLESLCVNERLRDPSASACRGTTASAMRAEFFDHVREFTQRLTMRKEPDVGSNMTKVKSIP